VAVSSEPARTDDERGLLLARIGVELSRVDLYPWACRYFVRSLELRPGSPETLHNLGRAQLRLGDRALAAARLHEALSLQPGSEETRRLLEEIEQ
jgi:Flp pilus assembly protein TadD